jgi:hypothetical protein
VEWIRKGIPTNPTHGIHCRFTQLMCKIVPLDEPNTVLTGHGAFHLHGTLDHAVDNTLSHLLFVVIEQDDS